MSDLKINDLVYVFGTKLQMNGKVGIIIKICDIDILDVKCWPFFVKFSENVTFRYSGKELIKIGHK